MNKMEEDTMLTITIALGVDGSITATESRDNVTEEWPGVIVIFGDVAKNKYAHLSWGERKDIVYGVYGSIMDARHDRTERGEWHRNVLGSICRMIMELYGHLRKAHEFTAEGTIEKFEEEDKKIKDGEIFH